MDEKPDDAKVIHAWDDDDRNDLPPVKTPQMVSIPAGEFIMGVSDEQIKDLVESETDWAVNWYDHDLFLVEQPQHRVRVNSFALGRFPVTNAEYQRFVWENGSYVPRGWSAFHYDEALAQHPVVGISVMDAWTYCQWLSRTLGQKYRLPTEAEWEYACRGVNGQMYPWGNAFDPWRCNTKESGKRGTTAVDEYTPGGDSPFGVIDMIGNVWEMTSSLLRPYPYDPKDGREDHNKRGGFVIRGGSWYYSHKLARCTSRESVPPTYTSHALGFRLASRIE